MNNVERHVLELIGEDPDNPDVYTDESSGMKDIRESVNDAIEEISILTGCYKETYYIGLRQGMSFYRFDFKRGSLAWITDVWLSTIKRRLEQTDLIRLNKFNSRWLLNSGSPESYFPIGLNYIGVWPSPASDTDILEITAVIVPVRYTEDTDRIKLLSDWEWAAAHFAVGEYYARTGDAKQAILHHNDYLKKLGLKVQYPYATEYVPMLKSDKSTTPKVTG